MRSRMLAPTLVAVAIGTVTVIVLLSGGTNSYTVHAVFADATGLRVHSDVKIGGVAGGQVSSMALDRHDHALVTVELNRSAAPVGRGATATIRPANLLGEYYVDLAPGNSSEPLPSGSTLPATATGSSVGLDQVLDTLDATTRQRLALLINETGIAFGDGGAQFAATLTSLPPSLEQARQVLAQLTGDNQNIETLLSRADHVVGAVSSRRGDLEDLVTTAAGALTTTAQHHASLASTIAAAPAALTSLRSALVNLGAASTQLRPAAQALLATSPPLSRTLAALPGFAASATRTLSALTDVSPQLTRLGRLGTPPVTRIQPVAARLSGYIGQLSPVLTTLDEGGFMNTLLRWMYNWASVTSTRDSLGHLFRVTIAPNADLVREALSSLTGASAARRHRLGRRSPVAAAPIRVAGPSAAPRPSTTGGLSGIAAGVSNKLNQTLSPLLQAVGQTSPGQPPSPPQNSTSLGALLRYLLKP